MSGHTNFNGFTPGGGIPSSFMNRANQDSPVSKEEPIDEVDKLKLWMIIKSLQNNIVYS